MIIIMKAIILAAGYATRLYPLTLNTPKALLTIGRQTIIDHVVNQINEIDEVDEIFLVSNHKFIYQFNEWNIKRKNCKKITIIDDGSTNDENKLGAVTDINLVISKYGINEDILVLASDNLFTFKLLDFYKYFLEVGKDCIIANYISQLEDLKRMGVIVINEENKIVDFKEKPANPVSNIVAYAGYIYKKETLTLFNKYISEGNSTDSPGCFPQWLYKHKDVYAYIFSGECFDIGTNESYRLVKQRFSHVF